MVLWTIVPEEVIFSDYYKAISAYEEINYSGTMLITEILSPGQYRIVRIMSTDPQDFLRPELQPGTVLSYNIA